jgi:hypothetical protein
VPELTYKEARVLASAIEQGCEDADVLAAFGRWFDSQLLNTEIEPRIIDGDDDYPIHEGQRLAWNSTQRIVALFCGWQSGKTSIGPWWLRREIQRCGAGTYAVISPHSPLLEAAALPLLQQVFELPHWKYSGAKGGKFTMTPEGELAYFGAYQRKRTVILTRHAQDPKAIESWTAKAIWVDEPGQMADSIWEALQARGMRYQARFLLTSRPYEHNWYVKEIWSRCMQCLGNPDSDPWVRRPDAPADIVCINFSTKANPSPGNQLEYERHSLTGSEPMAPWAFRMKYDGIPTRPAGLVYTSFQSIAVSGRPSNVVRFSEFFPHGLPNDWPIWVGLDFGKQKTAIVLVAEEMEQNFLGEWESMRNPRYCVFKSYLSDQQRTARDHMLIAFRGMGEDYLTQDENGNDILGFRLLRSQITAFGGATGESGWRESYALSGLSVLEPIITGSGSVDPQIQAVWTAFQSGRLLVCEHERDLIADIQSFSMELDKDTAEVTEKLKDEQKYHRLAALRYVVPSFMRTELEDNPPINTGKPVSAYG